MITKILVVSRHSVIDTIHSFNNCKIGIISIIDYPNDILLTKSFKEENQISQIPEITLCFNDLSKSEYDKFDDANKKVYVLFNKKHAEYIINFINCFKNEIDILIIHCYAGVSRSGAVGYWTCKYLNLNETLFLKDNPFISPNSYIYNILYNVSGLKNKIKNDLEKLFKIDNINSKNIF